MPAGAAGHHMQSTEMVSTNRRLASTEQHAMQQCGTFTLSAGIVRGPARQQLQQAVSLTPGSRCSLGCLAMKDRVAAASWPEPAWRSMLCRRSGARCWELPSASLLVVDLLSGRPAMGGQHVSLADLGLCICGPPLPYASAAWRPLAHEWLASLCHCAGSCPQLLVAASLSGRPAPRWWDRQRALIGEHPPDTSHFQPIERSYPTCRACRYSGLTAQDTTDLRGLNGMHHAACRPAPPVSDVLGRSTTLKLALLPPARRRPSALTSPLTD